MFECKLENTYEIKIHNGMTCIHENKENKLAECNLLHDILNPPKGTNILNSHYSPILQGYTNIHKSEAKFKSFQILFDKGFSSTTIMGILIKNNNKDTVIQ